MGRSKRLYRKIESPDLFEDGGGAFVFGREKFPYPSLIPDASFNIPVTVFANAKEIYHVKLIWDDEYEKGRFQEQDISF
jgi:hypothetical protein